MKRKILSALLAATLLLSACIFTAFADEDGQEVVKDGESIVVLFTNDVHCNYKASEGKSFGYAGVAAYKAQMLEEYENVLLVDAGDAIQGGPIGTFSKGQDIIDIMDHVGYNVMVPGNHEFDYGVDRLLEIAAGEAEDELQFVSCNFKSLESENTVFPGFKMFSFGETDVAFVGITTPETFTKSTPTYFQNENGEFIYSFCQGNNGQDLYDQVQSAVNDAKDAGAEYVIALGHLGDDEPSSPWRSSEVIANTTGIDALIDGHSHLAYNQTVANKDGEEVDLIQTKTALANLGKLVIDKDGEISAELISAETFTDVDEGTVNFIATLTESLDETLSQVVAHTNFDLTINDVETGSRAVRSAETNLGDLCADAYLAATGADIAFVNGGGVRANIPAGDITYGQIIEVHPFNNTACMVEVTGQQILDALEFGARVCPAENGGFLQVAGLSYTIDTTIPSSVVEDPETKMFISVDGDYRVKDVKVGEEDLDLEKTYKLASHNYMLKDCGDGFTMFKGANVLLNEIMLDNEVLINYIKDTLQGEVSDVYADPAGQGRITIITEEENTDTEPVDTEETDTEPVDTENTDTEPVDTESDPDTEIVPSPDTESDADVKLGDVDGDGEVTINDVAVIQKHLAQIEVENFNEKAADVDLDGEVTINDVTEIQKFLAKLIDSLGVKAEDDTEKGSETDLPVADTDDSEADTEAVDTEAVDTEVNSEENTEENSEVDTEEGSEVDTEEGSEVDTEVDTNQGE